MLTQAQLKEILTYNPDTGDFVWKNGRPAGSTKNIKRPNRTPISYIIVGVRGRNYRAHRLAWLYMTGEFPATFLDHKDGDGLNNRWGNLRLATPRQNGYNTANYGRYMKGVSPQLSSGEHQGLWYYRIRTPEGKRFVKCGFKSELEAHLAYCEHAKSFQGEFFTTR